MKESYRIEFKFKAEVSSNLVPEEMSDEIAFDYLKLIIKLIEDKKDKVSNYIVWRHL